MDILFVLWNKRKQTKKEEAVCGTLTLPFSFLVAYTRKIIH
jgi:hypothetical protein